MLGQKFPRFQSRWLAAFTLLVLGLTAASLTLVGGSSVPNLLPYADSSGLVQTYNTAGGVDVSGPFFQNIGSNDRTCVTCHQASDGWSVNTQHIQARFLTTHGTDPIFRTVDGADCPSARVSTLQDRKAAYSMLLSRGVIRVSLPVPANADFAVVGVNDPHNCPETTSTQLALFRRPLPSTNLPFLTTVMWDGRESFAGNTLEQNLRHQATDATLGHAEAAHAPTDEQVQAIVDFELRNFTAQGVDRWAGQLDNGASGGPRALSTQQFYLGINDPLGGNPSGAAFDPVVFTIFDTFSNGKSNVEARASILRGQALFNTLPIEISGVAGLNDKPGVPASFTGTCTTCHDSPNVGNHSVPLAINVGVADYPAPPALDIAGLPVYTVRCNDGKVVQTTDPGRALITGKCADIGKTKGPILRALASRAPYFHNGSAATLNDVVDFYDMRFNLHLTEQQKKDLVAFLGAL